MSVVPIYLSEISPRSKRAQLCSLNTLVIVLGILIAELSLGEHVISMRAADLSFNYIVLLSFPLIPTLVSSIGLFYFCPDSPRSLMILKRDESASIIALRMLRKSTYVREDLLEIVNESRVRKQERLVKRPVCARLGFWARYSLVVASLVLTLVVLNILFDSIQLKSSRDSFNYLVISMCVVALAASILSTALLSLFTKTHLLVVSLVGLALVSISFLVECVYFLYWPLGIANLSDLFDANFDFNIILLALFVLFASFGLVSTACAYAIEQIEERTRSCAIAVSACLCWAVYFMFELVFYVIDITLALTIGFLAIYVILVVAVLISLSFKIT